MHSKRSKNKRENLIYNEHITYLKGSDYGNENETAY